MSAARIQSHFEPKLYLKSHVKQILAASSTLLDQHGDAPWRRPQGDALISELAALHDTGKASAAFQRYIALPTSWTGRSIDKAHTPLSLVLTARHASAESWPAHRALAAALAVRGHHGAQVSIGEDLFRGLADDLVDEALHTQLPTVDVVQIEVETGLRIAPWHDLDEALDEARNALEDWLDAWRALPPPDMIRARFVARAAYSVLLEADKAFLAVERPKEYLHRSRREIPVTRVDRWCASLPSTKMDDLRERARREAALGFARLPDDPLLRLTLPTGAGKTLIAAHWALEERERRGGTSIDTPTVIIALPMLSIVDQTEDVWRRMLGAADEDSETLLPFHSLSERAHDPELEQRTAEFFIDTWRSEVVVTTFDQLLLALYSDRAKHAMRFHRLLNARIIIDEVQCIPPALWAAFSGGLRALSTLGRTRVLAMSATPSPCVEGAAEVLDPDALYAGLRRYELRLEHETVLDFDRFVTTVAEQCRERLTRKEGTLVTMNVRATAQETWVGFAAAGLDPLLLSGDMTPAHRLSVIHGLKTDPVRVVVSTQCVEAGVDLDMHHVIRDLAPLDALVQIAGRCNRHGLRAEPGTVTVVHVKNPRNGGSDARMIYDDVLLQCTQEVLGGRKKIEEREVLGLCRAWFGLVDARKYHGGDHFTKWARIEAELDVRGLLRGEDRDQEQVLVIEHDDALERDIGDALRIRDPWPRRSALRSLSARLAHHTVSVARPVFDALRTRPVGYWRALMPGQYDPVRGVDSRPRKHA